MANDGSVEVKVVGDDSDLKKKLGGIGSAAAVAAKTAVTALTTIGTTLAAIGVYAVKVGSEFETSLAKVGTIADTSKKSLDTLSSEVMTLSKRTGQSAAELNNALYSAISAGADTARATELVSVAVKAAKGGFTDTETAVDGLTSALNAYGMATADAQGLANKFLVTQNLGKTTFGELAGSIGTVAPTANAAGVSVDSLLASVASLTANGIGTSEAMTGMKAALSNIIKPTSDAAKMAEQLGVDFSTAALQSKGWTGFLQEIKDKTGGSTEQLSALFGSVEALNTVLTLTSDQGMALMSKTLGEMQTNTTALDDAYNTMTDTLDGATDRLRANIEGVGIEIYKSLENPLKQAASNAGASVAELSNSLTSGKLKGAMKTLSDGVGKAVDALSKFAVSAIPKAISAAAALVEHADKIGAALKGAVAALAAFKIASVLGQVASLFKTAAMNATLFAAGQSASAIATNITSGALTAQGVVTGVLTGKIGLATVAQAAWNAMLSANPIGLVVVAVAALVAGIVAYSAATNDAQSQAIQFAEKQEKLRGAIDEQREAREKLAQATAENLAVSDAEIGKVEGYIRELDSYTDKQGQVADAHKARADYLMNEINNLIPGAVEKLEDEAGAHYQIIDSIDKEIVAKRKAALLDAMQEGYDAALSSRMEAQNNYTQALNEQTDARKRLNDATSRQQELEAAIADAPASNYAGLPTTIDGVAYSLEGLRTAYASNQDEVSRYRAQVENAASTVSDAKANIDEIQQTLTDFDAATAIETPEQLDAAWGKFSAKTAEYAKQDVAAVQQATAETVQSYQRRREEIAAQYDGMSEAEKARADSELANMQAHLAEMANTVSEGSGTLMTQWADSLASGQPDVQAAMQLVRDGVLSAADATDAMQAAGYAATEQYAGGIAAAEAMATGSAAQVEALCEAALAGDTTEHGVAFMQSYLEGILATNPADSVRTQVQSAISALKSTQGSVPAETGGEFSKSYSGGIHDGAPGAVAAASDMAGQASAKVASAAPQFQESGKRAASETASGINSGAPAAAAAVSGMASDMLSAANAVSPSFSTAGANMAQGLMNGLSQMASRAVNAAANFALSMLQAAKDAVGIKSPSRDFREQVGRMMGAGTALGIGDSAAQVKSSIAMLSRLAFEDARDKAKDFTEIGGLYVANLTHGIEKGRDAALDKMERWLDADVEKFKARKDKTDEQKKSYEESAKEVLTAYKDALSDGYDEALDIVKNRVSDLTAEFKSQHDALLREQQTMQNKLSGFGDLFEIDKAGNLSLENINKSIDAVQRYDEALSALKDRGVSDEFMQQATALGVEEGTKFAEKLTKLPDEAFDSYTAAWQEQQDLAKAIAEKFYADQLDTLERDFAGKLDETLESVPNLMDSIGKDGIQGMIDGMYSKSGMLSDAARDIVNRAIAAMRMAADIHSPSKKTGNLVGKPMAEGIAVAFDKQMAQVYRRINNTLSGEIVKMSAGVKAQADRQAAKSSPAPVQTVYKTATIEKTPVIEFGGSLSALARVLEPHIRVETKRRGENMVRGEA